MTYLEKIKSLPPQISSFFLSDEPRYELEKSCYMYGMNDVFIAGIAPSIGSLYINELALSNLPSILSKSLVINSSVAYGIAYEINKRIFNRFPEYFTDSKHLLEDWGQQKSAPIMTEDAAWQKVIELEPWILEEQKEKRLEAQKVQEALAKLEKLSLPFALKKYPELGEQLITSDRISIHAFSEPTRPSIKNWLSDYTFTMGFDPHDSAARGTYLFHNENTKHLNQFDQAKLNYILKAFDTSEPVTVNSTSKQIVFPRLEIEAKPNVTAPQANPSPNNFSTMRNVKVSKPAFRPTFSGTFTLTRQNHSGPSLSDEKRLPTPPKEALLPVGHNISPRTPDFSKPAPPKSPDYQLPLQHKPRVTMAKDPLPTTKNTITIPTMTYKRPSFPTHQTPQQHKPRVTMAKDSLPTMSNTETALPSASKLAFTSPQKLPFEKETSIATKPAPVPATPSEPKEEIYMPKPIRITPMSHGKSYPSKNVVDLKE